MALDGSLPAIAHLAGWRWYPQRAQRIRRDELLHGADGKSGRLRAERLGREQQRPRRGSFTEAQAHPAVRWEGPLGDFLVDVGGAEAAGERGEKNLSRNERLGEGAAGNDLWTRRAIEHWREKVVAD